MKVRPPQFGVRENTASSRQHAPRRAMNALVLQSDPFFGSQQRDDSAQQLPPAIKETFEQPLKEQRKGTTGGGDSRPTTTAFLGDGKDSVVERPWTCEEAAGFVRVHPKTIKRMARRGDLPGHFRFARWFFYASELDRWMHGELHSPHRPCR